MKQYFAKFLPVEGKPKEGDWIIDSHSEPNLTYFGTIYTHLIGEELNFYKAQNEYYPGVKVELFLCSKDIQVGDKVFHERGWIGTVIETDYNDQPEVEVTWEGNEKNTAASRTSLKYLTKKIGHISIDANWVKNGDEFDEDDFQWITDDGDADKISITELRGYAIHDDVPFKFPTGEYAIKGPCAHFH